MRSHNIVWRAREALSTAATWSPRSRAEPRGSAPAANSSEPEDERRVRLFLVVAVILGVVLLVLWAFGVDLALPLALAAMVAGSPFAVKIAFKERRMHSSRLVATAPRSPSPDDG